MSVPESSDSCRIAITQGDYNGIGPEVVLKTLFHFKNHKKFTFLWFAHPDVVSYFEHNTGIEIDFKHIETVQEIQEGHAHLVRNIFNVVPSIQPGKIDSRAGMSARESLEHATHWCLHGKADALVTAPISKESINKAGFGYPGHTEYLANQTGSDHYIMMMTYQSLRVSLITIHIPVMDISARITKKAIKDHLIYLNRSLNDDFGIEQPSIAVLGLNPHAGDGGMIGKEEQDVIIPAISSLSREGIRVKGPFAADGFFANRRYEGYDAVVAMYHDQGLIPFKTLSMNQGVNVTVGLPIIRTSPDHGTAFDIAGLNRADAGSYINAIHQAHEIFMKRHMPAES